MRTARLLRDPSAPRPLRPLRPGVPISMNSYRSTVLERATLAFCIDALPERDALLFKSFIRLLDHMTHHQWQYRPWDKAPAPGARCDLLVLAEGTTPPVLAGPAQPGAQPQLLWLSKVGTDLPGFLCWPLKPDRLEKELNRLGGLALAQRSPRPGPAMFTGAQAGTPIPMGVPAKFMRLQQWPPAKLLGGPGRMRLATLLTGKVMSLDELAYRSALPLPLCAAFVDDLQRAGLLLAPSSASQPLHGAGANGHLNGRSPFDKPAPLGLFAKIRLRLGLQSNTH